MILSCDIGTSSTKTGIIDREGGLRWLSRTPSHHADATAWFRSFVKTVRNIPPDLRRALSAIAVSGHGPTLVPVGARGRPVAPALMWWDAPSPAGSLPSGPSFFVPKIVRFFREHPRQYEKTAVFLPSGEYLAFRLTGVPMAVIPHAGFIPYYWNQVELNDRRLDPDKLPALRPLGESAGQVTRAMSQRLGIRPGIKVYGCGVDFLMAILGSGTFTPGLVCDRGGTTEAVNLCTNGPLSVSGVRTVPGFRPGTFTASGFVQSAGQLHAWLKNRLLGGRAPFSALDALAEKAHPGCGGLRFRLPSAFAAGWQGRSLRTKDFYHGSTDRSGKPELARAFLEYLSCEVRRVFDRFAEAGAAVHTLRCTGGLASSGTLLRIKAALVGKALSLPVITHAELLGNALTALWASGEYGTLEEGAAALIRIREEVTPDPELSVRYSELYDEYVHNRTENKTIRQD
jgi:xylulokinase